MKRILTLLILCLGISLISVAQPLALLKSVFVYNFANMVEWPEADRNGDFIIGVLGGSDVSGELTKISTQKKVGTRTIKVENYANVADIGKCHIIFISDDKKSELANVIAKSKTSLVVSEEAGSAKKGAGISFIVVDNKIKFEMSKKNIEKNSLKVGTSLEKLAISVD